MAMRTDIAKCDETFVGAADDHGGVADLSRDIVTGFRKLIAKTDKVPMAFKDADSLESKPIGVRVAVGCQRSDFSHCHGRRSVTRPANETSNRFLSKTTVEAGDRSRPRPAEASESRRR